MLILPFLAVHGFATGNGNNDWQAWTIFRGCKDRFSLSRHHNVIYLLYCKIQTNEASKIISASIFSRCIEYSTYQWNNKLPNIPLDSLEE